MALLLQRHAGDTEARQHDGRVVVEQLNLRWCSDGFEIGCDNGAKVHVAFALDCCGREMLGHVATTEGIKGEDVQDLMITAVEYRFGPRRRLSNSQATARATSRKRRGAWRGRSVLSAGPRWCQAAEQRHGRSPRAHDEAGFCPGELYHRCED
jgi:transposase InsO family protein